MNNSGYSGKPLIEKLGYKPGETLYGIEVPVALRQYFSENGVSLVQIPTAVWVHGFFLSKDAVQEFANNTTFDTIEKGLWLSWPKRASNVSTDLTEQTFRDILLPMGWVDTKVVAVDQTWSGLKFLRRKNANTN